jgi:hypothetical protein
MNDHWLVIYIFKYLCWSESKMTEGWKFNIGPNEIMFEIKLYMLLIHLKANTAGMFIRPILFQHVFMTLRKSLLSYVTQWTRSYYLWVSDCCVTPTQQIFFAISWWEQGNFRWDDYKVCFVSAWNGRSPSRQMRLISYSGDQKLL